MGKYYKKTPAKNSKSVENEKKKSEKLGIKKKKWVDPVRLAQWIVIAVLCLSFIAYACVKEGVFEPSTKAKMVMGDYSTIEIAAEDVEITSDDVDSYIESFVDSFDTEEEETEGTVEDGDTVTITYVGYYDEDGEKGEEFDGGSDEDYELTIGSDDFIDGFEDGLIGEEIGDTVTLSLTFPDDYDDEDMAGVDVIFDVTISNRIVTVEAELTDDFVAENSEEYWGEQIDSIVDLEDYVFDYYYTAALHTAMLTALQELQTIKSYDSEQYALFYDASIDQLEYYADLYGYEADELAELYGYDDAESYSADEAEYYCALIMLYDKLWEDLGFEDLTDEEIENAVYEYMEDYGYEEDYTVDEFIEASGDAWYQTFIGIDMRAETIFEALEENVVIVEEEESTTSSAEE